MKPFDRTSSTPVRPVRESLAGIRKNTVSGIVNRFNHINEWTNDIADRQVSFAQDVSSINQASGNGIDSKWNSVDSGYDSFRRRTRSVSSINQPKSVIAQYEKYPNFKFSYLKYFGVDPTEYLSTFDIDFHSVSTSNCNDSSGRKANGVANESIMRTRSQTLTSERTSDSTVAKVSNLKFFGLDTAEQPTKMATVVEFTNFEDISSSKVAASRDAFLKKSLASIGTQTQELSLKKSLRSIATQTCELNLDLVDSDVVLSDGKMSPERESDEPSKNSRKSSVESDLKSRIQKSIQSYNNTLKAIRNGGIRKGRNEPVFQENK